LRYVSQSKPFPSPFPALIGVVDGKLSLDPDFNLFPVVFALPCPEAPIGGPALTDAVVADKVLRLLGNLFALDL
ncbi:hypothetical protein ACEQ6C_40405, partial [Rhizobium ruizarguesonis]